MNNYPDLIRKQEDALDAAVRACGAEVRALMGHNLIAAAREVNKAQISLINLRSVSHVARLEKQLGLIP